MATKTLKAKFEAQDGLPLGKTQIYYQFEDECLLQLKLQRPPHALPVGNKSFKAGKLLQNPRLHQVWGTEEIHTFFCEARAICLRRSLGKISALPPAAEFMPRYALVSGVKDASA
ncbi:hypothetical protein FS837_001606 [Tulasnella sp. UAMH 9824]|nr:hypothetical protein FS837_001606 [Tulasnella sp. UAMH 9824]